MQDRPTALELLQAVRELLEGEVAPGLADSRLRYHTLIAVAVLRMLERELPGEEARLRAEQAALEGLLGGPPLTAAADLDGLRAQVLALNRELCERIRRGEADAGPWRERLLAVLRAAVEDRLAVDNPARLAAFRRAEGGRAGPSPAP